MTDHDMPDGFALKTNRAVFVNGARAEPGYNVDKLDIAAGLRELVLCGYTDEHTRMVIQYALQRHARGEEEAARKGAIDKNFHGVNFTSWNRILAAAMAAAQ